MPSLVAEAAALSDESELLMSKKCMRLVYLPFSQIRPYHDHPFGLYTGERLSDIVESIQKDGILTPLIVKRIFDDPNYNRICCRARGNRGTKP